MPRSEHTAEKDAGLEGRYFVKKLNDAAHKHDDCRYFVFDPRHDLLALQALKYYARLARDAGYEPLADDLDQWTQDETERAITPRPIPPAGCDGCLCLTEHDGDYGSSGHAGACPPHTCVIPPATSQEADDE